MSELVGVLFPPGAKTLLRENMKAGDFFLSPRSKESARTVVLKVIDDDSEVDYQGAAYQHGMLNGWVWFTMVRGFDGQPIPCPVEAEARKRKLWYQQVDMKDASDPSKPRHRNRSNLKPGAFFKWDTVNGGSRARSHPPELDRFVILKVIDKDREVDASGHGWEVGYRYGSAVEVVDGFEAAAKGGP
jgi:hypothetical protein